MEHQVFFYMLTASFIWFLGYFHNGRLVRPKWKIPGKFFFYVSISCLLAHWYAHYSLLFIIGHPLIGLIFHTKICRENAINWWTCQPEERYLEIQERWAKGDFSKTKKED